jgi:hypothetical protein
MRWKQSSEKHISLDSMIEGVGVFWKSKESHWRNTTKSAIVQKNVQFTHIYCSNIFFSMLIIVSLLTCVLSKKCYSIDELTYFGKDQLLVIELECSF